MPIVSLLDLAPVIEGGTPREALLNARDLARHAEALGYRRFWMAEHHNMIGIASAATPVALGFIAAGTERIRVGAAGMMLPNHAPLIVAEQFGTLASLYPDRVDLGLGRAPGTDQETMRALRRDNPAAADRFPQDVQELLHYLEPAQPGQRVQAVPGAGTQVPVWILGSSLFGAQLAAALGLPYAFASHFAPDMLDEALHRGTPGRLGPPVDDPDSLGDPRELRGARHALRESAVGAPATVSTWLQQFVERTQVDELIVTGQIHDHAARKHSFAIAAEALGLSWDSNPTSGKVDAATTAGW